MIHDYMYLNTLPYGSDYDPPERILIAANKVFYTRYGYVERLIPCVRHGDDLFYQLVDSFDHTLSIEDVDNDWGGVVEGFLTSKHRFVDRKEAWKIALKQRQIVRLVGSQSPDSVNNKNTELFSENLY